LIFPFRDIGKFAGCLDFEMELGYIYTLDVSNSSLFGFSRRVQPGPPRAFAKRIYC